MRPAGDWAEVLGILANIREEAGNTARLIADDDDAILPSLRYMERESERAIALARQHALDEAAR